MSDKVTTEKINVRSPFFLTANSEGAPALPATSSDPVSNPTIPTEYVLPTTNTQIIQCGETIKIGEDVGSRIYKLNVGSVTGNVTVNYTVNVPVSITGYFNTTVPSTITTGFVGSNAYQQQLLDAGIGGGGMSLTSGSATGTITVNKSSASPETVEILVFAPLKTFDYQLVFNCPTAANVATPASSLPSVPAHTGFVEQIPAFLVEVPSNSVSDLQLRVNGTLVKNITTSGWYVFSDYPTAQSSFGVKKQLAAIGATSGVGYATGANGCVTSWNTATEYFAQSTYFTQGVNNISFNYTPKISDVFSVHDYAGKFPSVRYVKTGLFYDTIATVFRHPLFSQADATRFDWSIGTRIELNARNDNKVHIFGTVSPTATNNIYGIGVFGRYGDAKKHSIEFHWQSTTLAGLHNPTINSNSYFSQFKGRTYRESLDDGAKIAESKIIGSSTFDANDPLGCFT